VEGIVTYFTDMGGFGFINGEDKENYFVHYSNIIMEGFQTLQIDDIVEFEPSKNKKGLIAINVKLIK
jgi:CspA family cold shock protein